MDTHAAIAKQKLYYDEFAFLYWDQFFGTGRFESESKSLRPWLSEIPLLVEAMESFGPAGRVLELACGPGIWTKHLVVHADHVLAVDASPAMIAVNQSRVQSDKVRYICADLFGWAPGGSFDVVFFGFWLSHVPPERLHLFWQLVERSLKPCGRFFFIDDNYYEEHVYDTPRVGVCEKRTINGKAFEIVKVFYSEGELNRQTNQVGLSLTVDRSTHFVWGHGGKL